MGTIAFSLGEGYATYRIVISHTPTHTEINVRTSIMDPGKPFSRWMLPSPIPRRVDRALEWTRAPAARSQHKPQRFQGILPHFNYLYKLSGLGDSCRAGSQCTSASKKKVERWAGSA